MLSKQRDEKLKAIQEREALMIKATQEAMNAEAEENLRAEMARNILLTIEDELIEVVAARDQSRESEQKRREATLAEAEKSKAARLEAERDEAARIEAARVLAEEDAIRADEDHDEEQEAIEAIQSLGGPMTRSKAKKHQENLVKFMAKSLATQGREVLAPKPMMVIQAQEWAPF